MGTEATCPIVGIGNLEVHEGLAAKVDLVDVAPSHDLVVNEPHHAVALALFDRTFKVEPVGLFPIFALRKKQPVDSDLEKKVVTRVVKVGNPAVNVGEVHWPHGRQRTAGTVSIHDPNISKV